MLSQGVGEEWTVATRMGWGRQEDVRPTLPDSLRCLREEGLPSGGVFCLQPSISHN